MDKQTDLQKALAGIEPHIWSSEPEVGQFIASLISLTKAKVVVEIGTFMGLSSCYIMDAISASNSEFISVDIKDQRPKSVKNFFHGYSGIFVQQDSFLALDEMPNRYADIIFLDSYHSYEQVSGEFKRSERVIKQGGYIIMHDYHSHEGVKRWVDEIKKMPWFEVIIFTTPNNNGLAVVKCLYGE